jgi:hypothetical protein
MVRLDQPIEPMTLGNMRELGVRSLDVSRPAVDKMRENSGSVAKRTKQSDVGVSIFFGAPRAKS